MQSGLGAVSTELEAKDAWSPNLVAFSAASGLALVLLAQAASSFLLPLIGIVLLFLTTIFLWFCYDLFRRRSRHALSIFAAIAMATGIVRCAPLIAQGKDFLAFYARLPQFERQVEQARTLRTTREPLQIVVDYQDRSPFVSVNSFYYVVYDETDGAGPYKAEFWPYAGSRTCVIAVDVPTTVHHLTGHYYDFEVSY